MTDISPIPVDLTDAELEIIQRAAGPIAPQDRSKFLVDVGAGLAGLTLRGPGIINRVVAAVQKRYFNPPNFIGHAGVGKRHW